MLTKSKKRQLVEKGEKAAVTKIVKRVLKSNVEQKCYPKDLLGTSSTNSFAPVSAGWLPYSVLEGLPVDATATGRVGNKIRLTRICIQVALAPVPGATMANGELCRVVFYHDKKPKAAILTAATDVWTTSHPTALRNPNQLDRIKILRDVTHAMLITSNNAGTAFSAGPMARFDWEIKTKALVEFTGATTTFATLLNHDFGVIIAAENASCCVALLSSQVYYTDA